MLSSAIYGLPGTSGEHCWLGDLRKNGLKLCCSGFVSLGWFQPCFVRTAGEAIFFKKNKKNDFSALTY